MKNSNNDIDTHIIVTNDADVVIMLTTLNNLVNTFTLTIYFDKNEIISIGSLLDLHTNKYGSSINPHYDFTFVNLMMGNDYLPKIKLVDFEKIWASYAKVLNIIPSGIINDNLEINKIFLVKMFNNLIITSKQKFLNSFDPTEKLYENYCDGLTWCFHTYHSGICKRYDFMYEHKDAPHPMGLVINIINNEYILLLNNKIYPPINPILYTILVLPINSQYLIDEKYHKFMNKHNILYNEEKCNMCNIFYDNLKLLKLNNQDTKEVTKKFTEHKKTHTRLNLRDITNIINNFDEFNKKN
jgi:hypothetical protein